jgi:hypothetical protein
LYFVGIGPELSTENILQSISAALHMNNGPVMGQTNNKQALSKIPGANIIIIHLKHTVLSYRHMIKRWSLDVLNVS